MSGEQFGPPLEPGEKQAFQHARALQQTLIHLDIIRNDALNAVSQKPTANFDPERNDEDLQAGLDAVMTKVEQQIMVDLIKDRNIRDIFTRAYQKLNWSHEQIEAISGLGIEYTVHESRLADNYLLPIDILNESTVQHVEAISSVKASVETIRREYNYVFDTNQKTGVRVDLLETEFGVDGESSAQQSNRAATVQEVEGLVSIVDIIARTYRAEYERLEGHA